MKIYADIEQSTQRSNPRVIFPIVTEFPSVPMLGEVLFFNVAPKQGLYIFNGEGWISLYTSENNIWETIIAEEKQGLFELENSYNTDCKSIVVYKDGVRLTYDDFAEVSPNHIAWKGEELEGGEKFEFQLFNCRVIKPFDIKAFNRRNG
jgi:hypothetical protein